MQDWYIFFFFFSCKIYNKLNFILYISSTASFLKSHCPYIFWICLHPGETSGRILWRYMTKDFCTDKKKINNRNNSTTQHYYKNNEMKLNALRGEIIWVNLFNFNSSSYFYYQTSARKALDQSSNPFLENNFSLPIIHECLTADI